jgi:hypothetical protein
MSIVSTPKVVESKSHPIDSLALLGGLAVLLDGVWGGIASLGLDWSRSSEIVLGASLVLGLPAYLLDLWIGKRVPLVLLGLFIFRWLARCYGGPTFVLCNPLRGSVLLIVAFALLQWSRLRAPSA